MGKNTVDVTDATFDSDVLNSDKTVVVDFWAEWCGPCKMVAPVLEEIAVENAEKITIAKVNIDENPEIARRYQIMSIPTMSVFVGGKVDRQIVGAKPKSAILKDLSATIAGEDVLIVEDIIDTGLTLNYLIRYLRGKGPASLRICTLLDKPARRLVEIPVDYTGFTIPDQFVVGYGLDYGEHYRNLRYVGVLKPEVYSGVPGE